MAWSLPTRERGLKSLHSNPYFFKNPVAPYAGAWIEMYQLALYSNQLLVAPYAGAWIEIHPTAPVDTFRHVAPYAGAWIEID